MVLLVAALSSSLEDFRWLSQPLLASPSATLLLPRIGARVGGLLSCSTFLDLLRRPAHPVNPAPRLLLLLLLSRVLVALVSPALLLSSPRGWRRAWSPAAARTAGILLTGLIATSPLAARAAATACASALILDGSSGRTSIPAGTAFLRLSLRRGLGLLLPSRTFPRRSARLTSDLYYLCYLWLLLKPVHLLYLRAGGRVLRQLLVILQVLLPTFEDTVILLH